MGSLLSTGGSQGREEGAGSFPHVCKVRFSGLFARLLEQMYQKKGEIDMIPTGVDQIPDEERAAYQAIIRALDSSGDQDAKAAAQHQLAALIKRRARSVRKSTWDGMSRVLIGARVPKALAEEIHTAAQDTGRTLYRFVMDALTAELARTTGRGQQNSHFVHQTDDVQTKTGIFRPDSTAKEGENGLGGAL